MSRLLRSLPTLALLAGLCAILPGMTRAQPPDVVTRAQAQANGLAKSLRVLREDIDVDLPDARGAALGEIVDRAVLQVRQLQRATRAGGVTPGQLHKMVVDLDKDLDRLVASAASLGPDGYYLRKAAAQINAQNEALARQLAPPTVPPRVFVLTDQVANGLRALRDDIDIDLPDARGRALTDNVERCLRETRQIHRGARFGAPPGALRKNAADLSRELQRLVGAAEGLGSDAYYLRKSAAQINALGQELVKSMTPTP